jgi:MFS family permease
VAIKKWIFDMFKGKVAGKPRFFYGWVILAVAFITTALGYAVTNTFAVFYPTLVNEFGWSRGNTAVIYSINFIVYGLTAPFAGHLLDRYGPKIIIPVGACIMGSGLALCSLATEEWQFYLLFGVVVAIGLCLTGWAPFVAILSSWFVERRGLAYGVLSAGFGTSMLSAAAAQYIISQSGWKTAYIEIGIFAAVVIAVIGAIFLRMRPQNVSELTSTKKVGSSEVQSHVRSDVITSGKKVWSGTNLTLFKALRTYQFWLLFFMCFSIVGIVEQVAITHQVYFYQDAGYTPMIAATIYSFFGVLYTLGNLLCFLSDRLGREKVFITGCLLCICALPILLIVNSGTPLWLPLTFVILFGIGLGLAAAAYQTTVPDLFHGKNIGSIQGTISMAYALGGTLAPWFIGFIHDQTNSYFAGFLLVLGALILSIIIMLLLAPSKLRKI